MKIIINADDFGASQVINSEIERIIKLGAISSATILANGRAFDEVKQIVDRYPDVSFGAHLNIVEFDSLTKSEIFKTYNLVDDDYKFVYQAIFKVKHFPNDLKLAIKEEFRQQIEKIISCGIPISHIDGHQHCHAIYPLFDIVKELADEFGISKIRRKMPHLHPIRQMKYKYWIYKSGKKFCMTDYFFPYSSFVSHQSYKQYAGKKIELMCHPGLSMFDEETRMLEAFLLKEKCDYKLISYKNI